MYHAGKQDDFNILNFAVTISQVILIFHIAGLLNEYLSQTEDDEHLDADTDDQQHAATLDDEDLHHQDTTMLQNCFTSIVDTLASTNPRLISYYYVIWQFI